MSSFMPDVEDEEGQERKKQKSEHVIGTYNMSWFSGDSTKPIPIASYNMQYGPVSEYSWLRHLFDVDTKNTQEIPAGTDEESVKLRCKYWLNTLENLKNFILENNPAMIGLQEMNINNDDYIFLDSRSADKINETMITKEKVDDLVGTKAVIKMLNEINNTNGTQYKLLCGEVYTTFKSYVGICIIYDVNKIGEIVDSKLLDNPKQPGRPLLMAITDKGYLLATMHGAQIGTNTMNINNAFNNDMLNMNKTFLQDSITTFIGDNPVKNIYVTGDFNDRYDALTEFDIRDKVVKYDDVSPITGCPNWDSAGTSNLVNTVANSEDYKTCKFVPEGGIKGIALDEEHAKEANYLYKGDKCFSINGGKIEIHPSTLSTLGVSVCSDHKLVFQKVPVVSEGGKSRKSRKSKKGKSSKKGKKSRKSRKSKK